MNTGGDGCRIVSPWARGSHEQCDSISTAFACPPSVSLRADARSRGNHAQPLVDRKPGPGLAQRSDDRLGATLPGGRRPALRIAPRLLLLPDRVAATAR